MNHELGSYASALNQVCRERATKAQKALESGDFMGFADASESEALRQYRSLRLFFEESGVPKTESHFAVLKFRAWPENQKQPTHRIFAYLIAALGWKYSSGHRKPIDGSILNDFTAIATYGPYVDAMFIDKECAGLLSHGRLKVELNIKARIFSLRNRDELLQYLQELGDSAPAFVLSYANKIYGIK